MKYYVKNSDFEIKIGQNINNYQFIFNGYKDLNLNSKKDWFLFLEKYKDDIYCENYMKIDLKDLKSMILIKDKNNISNQLKKEGMLNSNKIIKDKEGFSILYNDFIPVGMFNTNDINLNNNFSFIGM